MNSASQSSADDAEALLRERWYDIDESHARLIVDAVRDVSESDLLDRPVLLIGAVIAVDLLRSTVNGASGDRAELLERFSNVAQSALARTPSDRNTTLWLVLRMIAARWRGDLDQAVAVSDHLGRIATGGGVRALILEERHEIDQPGQVALQRGLTSLLAGRTSAAMALFAEAYRAGGPPPRRHFAAANGAANAAMLAAFEGHDQLAEEWLGCVGDPVTLPAWCRELITVGAMIARAVLATDVLDLERAGAAADSLRQTGERFELWPFRLYALIQYQLAAGHPVQAYEYLKQVGFERDLTMATETVGDHIVFRAYLDTLIAGGEGGLVLRLAEDVGTPLRSLVPVARTRLLAGDDVGAARVAARAMRRVLISQRDMWEATIVHAIARMRQGEKEAALRSFGIVAAGRPRALPSILGRQQARDVQDLYALAGLEPPALSTHIDPLPTEIVVLTERERRVLQHLVDGLSTSQIAAADVTSEHTVRTHMKRIYRKLHVSSRDEAIAWANQQGLVRWHHQDGQSLAHI